MASPVQLMMSSFILPVAFDNTAEISTEGAPNASATKTSSKLGKSEGASLLHTVLPRVSPTLSRGQNMWLLHISDKLTTSEF